VQVEKVNRLFSALSYGPIKILLDFNHLKVFALDRNLSRQFFVRVEENCRAKITLQKLKRHGCSVTVLIFFINGHEEEVWRTKKM